MEEEVEQIGEEEGEEHCWPYLWGEEDEKLISFVFVNTNETKLILIKINIKKTTIISK